MNIGLFILHCTYRELRFQFVWFPLSLSCLASSDHLMWFAPVQKFPAASPLAIHWQLFQSGASQMSLIKLERNVHHSCALAVPGWSVAPNFCFWATKTILVFFIEIICWVPWISQVQSTGFPLVFLRAQYWFLNEYLNSEQGSQTKQNDLPTCVVWLVSPLVEHFYGSLGYRLHLPSCDPRNSLKAEPKTRRKELVHCKLADCAYSWKCP